MSDRCARHVCAPRPVRFVSLPVRMTVAALTSLGLAILVSCSDGEAPAPTTSGPGESAAATGPPSIVLIVVESLRTDAVASYGRDRRSPLPLGEASATPNLDALAAQGTRYAWAMAASSSTVTSHGSLLTGLDPVAHGAGLWARVGLPEDVETLAESLREAGYETVGFSENPMAGPEFGFDRGFDRFVTPEPDGVAARLSEGQSWTDDFRLVDRVRRWLGQRDASKPYFLFVNLADPHLPIGHAPDSRFLPEETPARLIDRTLTAVAPQFRLCREQPSRAEMDIFRAAYLDEVARADAKLGALRTLLDRAPTGRPRMIVTADHGTLFGEEQLLGHRFAAHHRALRVPLVVSGPDVPAGVVETPIAAWRIADAVRCLVGTSSACARGLPRSEADASASAEPIVSVVGNETPRTPPAALVDTSSLYGDALWAIANCPDDRGFAGRVVSYLKPPHRLIWRQHGAESLFDLSWDAHEMSDQIDRGGAQTQALLDEVEAYVAAHRLDRVHREDDTRPLPERATETYLAGRRALLADESVATDIVWFAQLILGDRPDEALRQWVEVQTPLHRDDLYYPIIDTRTLSATEVPAELPRGIPRFAMYLLAAVGGPDSIALPHFLDFLAIDDATDYILSHQISGLGWARALDRALPDSAYARMDVLLAKMAAEHAADDRFRDLWAERAAFLTVFGDPTPEDLAQWSARLVEHHLGDGDWGHTATAMTFDGDTQVGQHPRAHVRGMALVVLSRYLKGLGDPGLPNPMP